MPDQKTNSQILEIAREIVASEGFGAVSFDAIARRLGRSKQAVLYWYPTKRDLLAALFLPWLDAETRSAEEALTGTMNRNEAIDTFVRAIACFHLKDLDRYRMMYLVPQTTGSKSDDQGNTVGGEAIYRVTDRLYGALADHLVGTMEAKRREAVAIHSAVLGLVLMFALADALHDPLKHSEMDMIDALITSLTSET